ncbi:MAG: bifunctional proline dehydrogenase/L-glutamate gamma-semialdehyde dehydrogenase [Actinomycetota bacterium]
MDTHLASRPASNPGDDEQRGVDAAIAQVDRWLRAAEQLETRSIRSTMEQLHGVVIDDAGVAFVMAFIDRVARPDDDRVAARQLRGLVADGADLPVFLSRLDRLLLRFGSRLAPILPWIVMPLARRRMRAIVGHLVAPADAAGLGRHLGEQQGRGWASNVNLLGEAVLGRREAGRRLDALVDLLRQPDVDYVSVKLSSIEAQLNPWAYEASLDAVSERLADLIDTAAGVSPPTFVNVDMEEYRDLELTLDAFERVLGDPTRTHLDAGIVLQAYLPDALPALQRLAGFAAQRHRDGGGEIKVRLVKGANLAMEQVDADTHGWTPAPYASKAETDANYVRCLDWMLDPANLTGLRVGVASHNLFHVAWAMTVAAERGVADRIQIEMLQGMAEAHAAAVAADTTRRPLLYTPAVGEDDFDVAVGYLFRRLEETAAPDNFLRALFDLAPGSATFRAEADRFAASIHDRHQPTVGARRTQDRGAEPTRSFEPGTSFRNEPETDPVLPANRRWLAEIARTTPAPTPEPTDGRSVRRAAERARAAQLEWWSLPATDRRAALHRIGDEIARRRTVLMATMAAECGKTLAEADIELCEAIDFARYYGERAVELQSPRARFEPFGLVSVVPPWNFPVAIPAGGVLAALAAGNGVVFKPAPEAVRCGALVAAAIRSAGLPDDLVAFVAADDGPAARAAVEAGDAVILTGSSETADRFRSWDPSMRLFAETSGKNALVITPQADIDLAVQDLVRSAFGHAGQKCSAASLAILVGSTASSPRFRRQLIDAVETLEVRVPEDPSAMVGPLIGPPNERLDRAFHRLDPGESWLVEPELLDPERNLWRPGVRIGVQPGSWFHRTECFGPVLGLMAVATLAEAIELQNGGEFGLTGGIHSLDPAEVERWVEEVEVGNAYVNRVITGAIVQRQPFGGWKRSAVGPGAKAGGPNYVAQLGRWTPNGDAGTHDYEEVWRNHLAIEHDPSGLAHEQNVFRYRPLARVLIVVGDEATDHDLALVRAATDVVGVGRIERHVRDAVDDLRTLGVDRVRVVGGAAPARLLAASAEINVHVADQPVVADGRIELLHYVREQAVSITRHRFGNLLQS